MNKIILRLPRKKSEKANMFHMNLTDFVGEIFREEFIIALDSIISNQERGNNKLEDNEILIEIK